MGKTGGGTLKSKGFAMTAQPKRSFTEAEYLAFEQASEHKHEYYQGAIYAMTGGTEFHTLLAGNTYAALHAQLRRRECRVYTSDQRIKVIATGLHTYPDVTVVCGAPQFVEASRLTLINPTLIVEVLSPSTERYDRGMKFRHYRMIPSLHDYLLIAQDDQRIEHYSRQDSAIWQLYEAVGMATQITLRSIGCVLALADVYEKVELEPNKPGITREVEDSEAL
jgi:Uma2 family endonuclease